MPFVALARLFLFPFTAWALLICLNCVYVCVMLSLFFAWQVGTRYHHPDETGRRLLVGFPSPLSSPDTSLILQIHLHHRLSNFHLDRIISSGYNDKDVYRRSTFNDTWYILCIQICFRLIWIILNTNSIFKIHNFGTRIQALSTSFQIPRNFYLSANIKYLIDHCLHHIAVKYIH